RRSAETNKEERTKPWDFAAVAPPVTSLAVFRGLARRSGSSELTSAGVAGRSACRWDAASHERAGSGEQRVAARRRAARRGREAGLSRDRPSALRARRQRARGRRAAEPVVGQRRRCAEHLVARGASA